MSLGEILDRTAQLYRGHFMLFAGIASVYAGVVLVFNLIQIAIQQTMVHFHMAAQLQWVTLGYLIVLFPLIVVFAGAAVAANNRAVAWVNLDQPATIRGAYSSTLPRLGRYLWLMTIVFFFVYIPFIVLFTGYFLFLFIYARPKGLFSAGGANADPQAMIVIGLVSVGFAVLCLGALVYSILMALRYSLAIPASVVEDLKARKAIRRSIELSKGSRGRIFVLGLLISAIQIGLVSITQVFFLVAMYTAVKHHAELPAWLQIVQQIVGFLTNSFIGPMYATGLTLFYYDQRIRKEGFDIERMMEAAGMTPAAIPVEAPAAPLPWPELPQAEAEAGSETQDRTAEAPESGPGAHGDAPESPHG